MFYVHNKMYFHDMENVINVCRFSCSYNKDKIIKLVECIVLQKSNTGRESFGRQASILYDYLFYTGLQFILYILLSNGMQINSRAKEWKKNKKNKKEFYAHIYMKQSIIEKKYDFMHSIFLFSCYLSIFQCASIPIMEIKRKKLLCLL